jgi:hypothetical protein
VPSSPAGYLVEAQFTLESLGRFQLARPMTADLIEQVLGTLILDLHDEVHTILEALHIPLAPGLVSFPLRVVLEALRMNGLDLRGPSRLLEGLTADMLPADPRGLERLYMVMTGCHVGLASALDLADDAMHGVHELIELVFAAGRGVEHVAGSLENLPLVGGVARVVRRAIVNRLVRSLSAVVDLMTLPIPEPHRARIRAVAAIVTAVYLKWMDLSGGNGGGGGHDGDHPHPPPAPGDGHDHDHDHGPGHDHDHGAGAAHAVRDSRHGGGVLPFVTVGVTWLGKVLLVAAPRLGATARLQGAIDLAAARAASGDVSGETALAARLCLFAGQDAERPALVDGMQSEAVRRSKVSHAERSSANVAGAIADVAQILGVVEPSGVARIVTIAARLLQGGLLVHSVYYTGSLLYRIPKDLRRLVDLAFHPDTGIRDDDSPVLTTSPDPARVRDLEARIAGAAALVDDALDQLGGELLGSIDAERMARALERADAASDSLVSGVRSTAGFQQPVLLGPASVRSPTVEALLDQDLKLCALFGECLAVTAAPRAGAPRRRAGVALDALRHSTRELAASATRLIRSSRLEDRPGLSIDTRSVLHADQGGRLSVTIENTGARIARQVVLAIGAPRGTTVAPATSISLGDIAQGARRTVEVAVDRGADPVRGCLLLHAVGSGDLEATRPVWLRP